MEIETSFVCIFILFVEAFKYDDGAKCWGYVGQKLNDCVEFHNFVQYFSKLFQFCHEWMKFVNLVTAINSMYIIF
jgi:hypothetical protein